MRLEVKRKLLFWYVRLVADNGEVLMHSETYYNRYNAVRSARRLSAALDVEVVDE